MDPEHESVLKIIASPNPKSSAQFKGIYSPILSFNKTTRISQCFDPFFLKVAIFRTMCRASRRSSLALKQPKRQ